MLPRKLSISVGFLSVGQAEPFYAMFLNHLEYAANSTEIIANGNTPILRAPFDFLSCSSYQELSELPTVYQAHASLSTPYFKGACISDTLAEALYCMNSVRGAEYWLFIVSKAVSRVGRHGRVVVEAPVTFRGTNFR